MKKRLAISETIAQAVAQVERAIDALQGRLEIAQAVENEPTVAFTSPADLAAKAIRKQEEIVQSLTNAKDTIQARGFEMYLASAPKGEIEKIARQAKAYDKPIGEAQRALNNLKLLYSERPYTHLVEANASLQAQQAHESIRERATSMRRAAEGQLKDYRDTRAVLLDLSASLPSDRHLHQADEPILQEILRKIDNALSQPLYGRDLSSLRIEPYDGDLQELNDRALELLKQADGEKRGHAATASLETMVTACFKATGFKGTYSADNPKRSWDNYGKALADPKRLTPADRYVAYWAGFSASQMTANKELTQKVSENVNTTALLTRLSDELDSNGPMLLSKLGVLRPVLDFHIFNAVGKGIETDLGGDFALVVMSNMGLRSLCRYAVVQMKNADKDKASVYRKGARQFKNLGIHKTGAFYGFAHRQGERLPQPAFSFRSHKSVGEEILPRAELKGVEIQNLREGVAWDVDVKRDAIDFPSMLQSLVVPNSSYGANAGDPIRAIESMAGGGDPAKRLVDIIAICCVGRKLEPKFFEALALAKFEISPPEDNPLKVPRASPTKRDGDKSGGPSFKGAL